MKNHHIHLLLALPLLIAACSQDDEQQMQPAQAEVSLSVSAAIEGTRAPIERTVFLKDESISTCLMQGDSTLLSWRDFRFDGSTWTAVQPARLQPWQGSAVAYAVYPALADSLKNEMKPKVSFHWISGPHISGDFPKDGVHLNIYPLEGEQQEYLYASSEVEPDQRTANLLFHFALTRVTFIVSKGTIYETTNTKLYLSKASLTNSWNANKGKPCLYGRGFLDLESGIIYHTPYVPSSTINDQDKLTITLPVDSAEITKGSNAKVDFLVIPTTLDGNVSLELTVNDKQYSLPLPEGTVWEKGRQYTYPVTLDYNF